MIEEEILHRINSVLHAPLPTDEDILLDTSKNYNLAVKTTEFLHSNIDKGVTLEELSRKLSTNRNTLSEAFKEHKGMTIFSWFREQRLLKAASLLASTSLSVTRISEEVGFYNSNNFSSAFKKRFNISPLQYRKHKLRPLHSQLSSTFSEQQSQT